MENRRSLLAPRFPRFSAIFDAFRIHPQLHGIRRVFADDLLQEMDERRIRSEIVVLDAGSEILAGLKQDTHNQLGWKFPASRQPLPGLSCL